MKIFGKPSLFSAATFFAVILSKGEHLVEASGDDGHNHDGEESCACAAAEHGFTIDCSDQEQMTSALAKLNENNCGKNCESEVCHTNFLIIRTHHDFCLEDVLPKPVEDSIHVYEDVCEGCHILRQPDPEFDLCDPVVCEDGSGNAAYTALLNDGCLNECNDAATECGANFRILRAFHDLCDHDDINPEAETGLHDLEVPCKNQGCNVIADGTSQLVCDDPHTSAATQPSTGAAAIAALLTPAFMLL